MSIICVNTEKKREFLKWDPGMMQLHFVTNCHYPKLTPWS